MAFELLVRSWNRDGLSQCPALEFLEGDLHAEFVEGLLRGRHCVDFAARLGDGERVSFVLQFGIGPRLDDVRRQDREDGEDEKDGECTGERPLSPLLFLFRCGVHNVVCRRRHDEVPFMGGAGRAPGVGQSTASQVSVGGWQAVGRRPGPHRAATKVSPLHRYICASLSGEGVLCPHE